MTALHRLFAAIPAWLAGLTCILVLWGGVLCGQGAGQAGKAKTEKAEAEKPAAEKAEKEGAEKAEAPAAKSAKPAPAADSGEKLEEQPAEAEKEAAPKEKPWKSLNVDEEQKKNQSKVVTTILRAGKFASDADQDMVDAFYKTYFLPLATRPENLRELPRLRSTLRNHFSMTKAGATYDYLNALVLEYAEKTLAKDSAIHPAVRVNAVLMIGELSAAEPVRPVDPPDPCPEAAPVLLRLVEDSQQLEGMRVAALAGLVRHARFGLHEAAVRNQVAAAMVKLLQSGKTEGRADAALAWIPMQAAEVLGLLGGAGNGSAIATELAALAGNNRNPLIVRCAGARALGQLDLTGVGEALNPSKMAADVGGLATDAAKDEIRSFNRRRLKTRLQAVLTGLKGSGERGTGIVKIATVEPHLSFVDKIRKPVAAMIEQLDDKSAEDEDLVAKLQPFCDKVENVLKTAPAN